MSKERVVMTTSHGDIQLGFYPEVRTSKRVSTRLLANHHRAPVPRAQICAASHAKQHAVQKPTLLPAHRARAASTTHIASCTIIIAYVGVYVHLDMFEAR